MSPKVPGPNRTASDNTTRPTAQVQANQRHRGEGRCPSGNNSRRKPEMPMNGTQVGSESASPTPAPGSPFARAYSA